MMKNKQILVTGFLLMCFAIIGSGIVAITFESTKLKIAENQRLVMLKRLHEVMPAEKYNNDLLDSIKQIPSDERLGTKGKTSAYIAKLDGVVSGFIFSPTAPDGYSGAIKLLVGIYADGTLSGVRVVSHKETPGLGDAIEANRNNWIFSFTGRSLQNPQSEGWSVRRDGGEFDQFTGATITPRAVVNAVHLTLIYFDRHKKHLLQLTEQP